jgi:hypothetical protein
MECPSCGARAGTPCLGLRGTPRVSCHLERHELATELGSAFDRHAPPDPVHVADIAALEALTAHAAAGKARS